MQIKTPKATDDDLFECNVAIHVIFRIIVMTPVCLSVQPPQKAGWAINNPFWSGIRLCSGLLGQHALQQTWTMMMMTSQTRIALDGSPVSRSASEMRDLCSLTPKCDDFFQASLLSARFDWIDFPAFKEGRLIKSFPIGNTKEFGISYDANQMKWNEMDKKYGTSKERTQLRIDTWLLCHAVTHFQHLRRQTH